MPVKLYQAEVVAKEQINHKTYILTTKLIDPPVINFKAGQCVGFHLDDKQKRLYTIASAPSKKSDLEFCVDVSPMGDGSKYVLDLKAGDRMTLEGPYGGLVVSDTTKDLMLIATGVGVAPFRSIVEDCLQNGFPREITLLLGVRSEEDKLYFEYFESLASEYENFIFIPVLSKPKGNWNGAKGRVTDFLDQNYQSYKDSKFYICGGPEMVKDVRTLLVMKGAEPREIKIELFV